TIYTTYTSPLHGALPISRQTSAKQEDPTPKLTAERHALLGSAHKEMAWIAFDPAEVGKHLHLSYRHYRDAYRADKKKPPYPAQIMALLARAALARGLTAVESPAELDRKSTRLNSSHVKIS